MIKSIGLSLAVGVLADAFIVRMTLVPAVMALLGDAPGGCRAGSSGSCPNVDIEGEQLTKSLQLAAR